MITRRRLLGVVGASMGAGLVGRVGATTVSDLFSTVETADGRVRGLVSGGVHVFLGLRYGADTSGANRWMPPQPVAKWSGVRDATAFGNYAPQMPADRRRAYSDLIMYDFQPGGMGEDCLVLNVWTPALGTSARKPVLVHLHGGGFYAGSGNSPQFDGEMLARHGDAVVITVNHRLGSFGFLDLSAIGGERHAQSGANGMLDLVAALRWIRENVAAFGGDPSRVLVFGQSGGGQKTSALLAMPSARGFFQRAGVMSGSLLRGIPKDASRETAERFLKIVGTTDLDRLRAMPFEQLLAAQVTLEDADRAKGEAPRAFQPVVDGVALPRHPFDPDAPPVSADVPMIVSTVLDERAYRKVDFDLDEAGFRRFADSVSATDGAKLAAMYRDEDPKATPFVLQARLDSDATFRRLAVRQAERKAAAGGAPVWTYLWKIPSPAYGGRYGTPHGTDIGPSMHDVRQPLTGAQDANVKLADQLASAWVAFAATGDPNNAATPRWPAYGVEKRTTLVFEGDAKRTAAVDDPRRAFREYWASR